MKKTYRHDLDLLKGIAILAVVLYHMGITRSGYLGVDAFLVINGFFIVPRVVEQVGTGDFRYFAFLEKRVIRLLPLLLLVSAIVMAVGYWGMYPNDYENLSESVVATSFFSNNILSSITLKNYWNTLNDYKALMHTWYVGVLFEFYVVFPLIPMLVKMFSKRIGLDYSKSVIWAIVGFTVLSLLMYLNPNVSTGDRFYLLPCRFFEMTIGGLAGVYVNKKGKLLENNVINSFNIIVLSFLIFYGLFSLSSHPVEYDIVTGGILPVDAAIPQLWLLLMVVCLSVLFVISDNAKSPIVYGLVRCKVLCLLGLMSYSIFIWHQPLLAFYRYFIAREITTGCGIVFVVAIMILSVSSYYVMEKKIRLGALTRLSLALSLIVVNGAALWVYFHAGVVRDVPELNIVKDEAYRDLFSGYNDRISRFDNEFPVHNGKINVLLVGNSFVRDWGNILLESEMADKINLSYSPKMKENLLSRISQSDYIFVFDWKKNIPNYVWENLKSSAEVWGLGTKSYGSGNGIIYKNRNKTDYYAQTAKINPNFFVINDRLRADWGGYLLIS